MSPDRLLPFVHQRYRADPDAFRAASYLVVMSASTAAFAVGYTLVSVLIGLWPGVLIMGLSTVGYVLLPLAVRRGVRLGVVAHAFIALSFAGTVGSAYFSGGFASPVMPWIAASALTGLLVAGPRGGRLWLVIAVAAVAAMWVPWAAGAPILRAYDAIYQIPFSLACYAGLIVILYALGLEFEREKERALSRLAHANAELTTTLDDLNRAEARLVQHEKMASLGRFTSGVAHEMKNPLNFITNFAALNEELAGELEAELTERLGTLDGFGDLLDDLKANSRSIGEHGRRADHIVRSMLQHTRGAGKRRRVDLNALVKEHALVAYQEHRRAAREPGVALEHTYEASAGSVEAVPEELGQVSHALVANALYAAWEVCASRDGHVPTVSVHTARSDGGVEVRVEDNGGGVPEEIRSLIFEPFFTTKPPGHGAGLGLSLSYDVVVHGHGGRLETRDRDGGGTVVAVWLPDAAH